MLQVVASLAKEARAIRFTDSTGQLIEVYEGALGQEVLRGQLGGPTQELPCHLSKGSRVSLRAAENTAITTGTLYLQFMGQL